MVESAASTSAVSTSEDVTMSEAEKSKQEAKKEEGIPKRAGIVLAAEKRVTSKLLDKEAGGGREKLFTVNEYVKAIVLLFGQVSERFPSQQHIGSGSGHYG